MELHPEEHVEGFLDTHRRALAVYHDYLDRAVPKAFAKWEPEYPDANYLPGETLCISVRTLFWTLAKDDSNCSTSLALVKRRPASRQLVDSDGNTIRIRRHPWQHQYWRRVPVTPLSRETLWGVDPTPVSYELAILWTPSREMKALGSAVLAAVCGLDTSSVAIYHRVNLPVLSSSERTDSTRPGSGGSQEVIDDFEDFDNDDLSGEDPA